MDLKISNQVAFVAGSSRGIGRAIAATLLAEGAQVVITGRGTETLEQTARELDGGHRVLSIAGDLSQSRTIEAAFAQAIRHFGKVDHLILNLGTGTGKPGWEHGEEEWDRLFEANFFGSVRLAQAAVPHLRGKAASILFISSIVALEATPAPLPYSAAKAALNNYAKNLSRQLAPEQIRVNTICPGNIYFPGGSWERHLQNQPEAVEAMLKGEVPQGRFGLPEEIASLAAYLCSSYAHFSTGGVYVMDGGQTRSS